MAFWNSLLRFFSGAAYRQAGEQRGVPAEYSGSSAVTVTPDTALGLSAAWACVKLLTETVSSMPVNIYRKDRLTGLRVLLPEHNLSLLFDGKVNRWQTRLEFMETMTYQLVLFGNCYALKQKNTKGQLVGLVPLMSEQMRVELRDDGAKMFHYSNGKNVNVYNEDEIWHVKLFGNGIIGLSPIGYGRNSLGIGQGAEAAVSKIYAGGGQQSGILTIDKVLQQEQREAVRKNFQDGKDSRLLVLEAGFQYTPTSLSPQDIELLASRRYQVEEIARLFGVPSVMINDTQGGTWGSGIQMIMLQFYKQGIQPILERYESSMRCWLIPATERYDIEIEFDFSSMLKQDKAERFKMYREAISASMMTPNEARALEGWQPLEGGDKLLAQQQIWPLEKITAAARQESGVIKNNE